MSVRNLMIAWYFSESCHPWSASQDGNARTTAIVKSSAVVLSAAAGPPSAFGFARNVFAAYLPPNGSSVAWTGMHT